MVWLVVSHSTCFLVVSIEMQVDKELMVLNLKLSRFNASTRSISAVLAKLKPQQLVHIVERNITHHLSHSFGDSFVAQE